MGALNLLILPFMKGFGALKFPPKKFSLLILVFYYFIWILSFLITPNFLFYNDFKGFYDTVLFGKKYAFYIVKFNRKVIMSMGSVRLEKMAL